MVIYKQGRRLYNGVSAAIVAHARTVAAELAAAPDVGGDAGFLQEVYARWREHKKTSAMMRDVVMVRCRPPCTSF